MAPRIRTTAPTATTFGELTDFQGHKIASSDDAKILFAISAKRDIIVLSISSYKGDAGLDLRRFYLDDESETWRPTSKGVRLAPAGATEMLAFIKEYQDAIVRLLSSTK